MKINRKEIKQNAKKSIKKHYFIFVISLLLCAVLGIFYTSSTNIFSALKGGNGEKYTDISEKMGQNAYFNEYGELIINNTVYDSSNDIAEAISNFIQGKKDEALNIENRMNTIGENQPDEKVGIVTLGYRNGVLASLVNSVKSGSLILSTYKSVQNVIKDPSASTIILLILGVLLFVAHRVFIKNFVWLTVRRQFTEGQTYDKITTKSFLSFFHRKSYFRVCITFFVKEIFQMLWSMTIVGGVIKFYSYAMVSYIIGENPRLTSKEAISLSRKMMNGHKWELFVLDISFIGWELLNVLTIGLLGLFFLNPYIESTRAQFYLRLRQQSIDNKIEGYELLNDYFLAKKPTEDDLQVAYSDVIELSKNAPKEIEKFTGVAGFFANTFGIVLRNSEKANRISQQEEDALQIEEFEHIREGILYPERLSPQYTAEKGKIASKVRSLNYLRRYSITSLIAIFFAGCLVGWLWEVGIHLVEDGVFVNRGVLHGPWLPIYGSGGALILVILYRFRNKPWLEFTLTILLCGVVEYATSYILEVTHDGQKWWDYTGYFLNINGRVCAEGLLVFGVAGAVAVYVLFPLLDDLLLKIPLKVLLPIVIALIVIFVVDIIYSHFYPNTGKGITDYNDGKQTGFIDTSTTRTGMYIPDGVYIPDKNTFNHYTS